MSDRLVDVLRRRSAQHLTAGVAVALLAQTLLVAGLWRAEARTGLPSWVVGTAVAVSLVYWGATLADLRRRHLARLDVVARVAETGAARAVPEPHPTAGASAHLASDTAATEAPAPAEPVAPHAVPAASHR